MAIRKHRLDDERDERRRCVVRLINHGFIRCATTPRVWIVAPSTLISATIWQLYRHFRPTDYSARYRFCRAHKLVPKAGALPHHSERQDVNHARQRLWVGERAFQAAPHERSGLTCSTVNDSNDARRPVVYEFGLPRPR